MMESLQGTGVALVTPFDQNLKVDYDALARIIDFVKTNGVDYLVVSGTTGESPTVTWEEKLQILDFVIEKNRNEIPVVFGLGGNNTVELLSKLDQIADKDIAAILSASPYYSKPSQEGLEVHYEVIADASAFPVILYNVPARTASNIESRTTLRLAKHENIIAIKEASRDLVQVSEIIEGKEDSFLVLSGDDQLTLPILALGGRGVISVAANAFPASFCKMVKSALKGDYIQASSINNTLVSPYALLGEEGNPTSVKAALKSLGLCEQWVRLPLMPASNSLIEKFGEFFETKKG